MINLTNWFYVGMAFALGQMVIGVLVALALGGVVLIIAVLKGWVRK